MHIGFLKQTTESQKHPGVNFVCRFTAIGARRLRRFAGAEIFVRSHLQRKQRSFSPWWNLIMPSMKGLDCRYSPLCLNIEEFAAPHRQHVIDHNVQFR